MAHPSTHPNLDPTGEGEGSLTAAAAAAAAATATAAAVAVLLPEPSRLTKMALNTAVLIKTTNVIRFHIYIEYSHSASNLA